MGKAKHWKWVELELFDTLQDGDIISDRKGGVILGRIVKIGSRFIILFYKSHGHVINLRYQPDISMFVPENFLFENRFVNFYRKVPVVVKEEVIIDKPTASVIGINEESNIQQESQEGSAQSSNPVTPVKESEVIGECSIEGMIDRQPLVPSLEYRPHSEHKNFRTGIVQCCKKLKKYVQFLFGR